MFELRKWNRLTYHPLSTPMITLRRGTCSDIMVAFCHNNDVDDGGIPINFQQVLRASDR